MKKKLLLALLSATMVTSAFSGDWSTIKIGTEGAYPPWNGTNLKGLKLTLQWIFVKE